MSVALIVLIAIFTQLLMWYLTSRFAYKVWITDSLTSERMRDINSTGCFWFSFVWPIMLPITTVMHLYHLGHGHKPTLMSIIDLFTQGPGYLHKKKMENL